MEPPIFSIELKTIRRLTGGIGTLKHTQKEKKSSNRMASIDGGTFLA